MENAQTNSWAHTLKLFHFSNLTKATFSSIEVAEAVVKNATNEIVFKQQYIIQKTIGDIFDKLRERNNEPILSLLRYKHTDDTQEKEEKPAMIEPALLEELLSDAICFEKKEIHPGIETVFLDRFMEKTVLKCMDDIHAACARFNELLRGHFQLSVKRNIVPKKRTTLTFQLIVC